MESRPSASLMTRASGPAAVVLCDCSAAVETVRQRIEEIEALLRRTGTSALRLRDLCGAVARREASLVALARRPLLVIACRPRAVRWLLRAGGLEIADGDLSILDLRSSPRDIQAELSARLQGRPPGVFDTVAPADDWIPWFPVIDHDRCQRCRQCASFCMFGVYSARSDGRVEVVRPRSCKTNCPACARICPSAAIIFPKHDEPPFDGSEISDEEAVRARTRNDTQRMLGLDPYAALRERRRRVELLRPSGPAPGE